MYQDVTTITGGDERTNTRGRITPRMGEIEMNPTDEAILSMLRDGRCSPAYIAEQQGYSRQNVTNRLGRLV